MRYLRATGVIGSLCMLLCGMALQMDALVRLSLLINVGAAFLCFLDQPAPRATLTMAMLCILGSALALLDAQGSGSFLTIHSALGDRIVPAGESAYRTVGACIFALLAGATIGETALEGLLGKTAFASRAGWAGVPVRACAILCLLTGMAACLAPVLCAYIAVPASILTVTELFTPLATGAAACYVASARSKTAAVAVLILYIACAVFDPALFALHAFFALVYSVLLCAKSGGREGLLCLMPAAGLLWAIWFNRTLDTAVGLQAARLWQAVVDFTQPGSLEWALQIYARFGIYGFAAAGIGAGALLFLLGRLLRDSFLYSAPVLWLLGWGGLILFKGVGSAPQIRDIVAFFVPFGLCLIVGCIRRANARKR